MHSHCPGSIDDEDIMENNSNNIKATNLVTFLLVQIWRSGASPSRYLQSHTADAIVLFNRIKATKES